MRVESCYPEKFGLLCLYLSRDLQNTRDQLACTHFSKFDTRDTISRDTNLSEKFFKNICEQEKSCSLSKSSFSVLLLLISTLSLKLKLLLLFCSAYVLCNTSASHWKHKLLAVCAPKDLLPPISPYIFHQLKYWAYLKVIFRVSSALKSFYHLAHLMCQFLAFLPPPGDLGIGLV